MKIKTTDIPTVLPALCRAGITPIFIGPPGIGKTDLVHEAAQQLGESLTTDTDNPVNVVVRELHLASMSEVDIRGYLIPVNGRAMFTKPEFWSAVEENEYGILFLDEFPQAPHESQKAVAPLIYDGRIGEYTLPKGKWFVVLAGNRVEDNAGSNTLLSHVLNRLCYVEVEHPDPDRWVAWAARTQLVPELIAFAKLRPDVVFNSTVPDQADTPYCTPRTLHMAGRAAREWPGGLMGMVTSPQGMTVLSGLIGKGAAAELAGVMKSSMKLKSFEEIIAAPDTIELPTALDEIYVSLMLVAMRAEVNTHNDQAFTYITRFAPNFALTGILALLNRDVQFSRSKVFSQWITDNADVIDKFREFIAVK